MTDINSMKKMRKSLLDEAGDQGPNTDNELLIAKSQNKVFHYGLPEFGTFFVGTKKTHFLDLAEEPGVDCVFFIAPDDPEKKTGMGNGDSHKAAGNEGDYDLCREHHVSHSYRGRLWRFISRTPMPAISGSA
ncbi:MAG: hypothetical protein Q9223_001885 [Gallowayella weberi]